MRIQVTIDDWIKVQNNLKQIDYWQECPPFASFSMAGETHTLYTDSESTYETVNGNGFGVYYKYDKA